MQSDDSCPSRRALILIPGTVNYFYNLSGRRIAESLRALGFAVDVRTLDECSDQDEDEYDWCLLSNISEILHAWGDEAGGLARIGVVGRRCRTLASLAIDCTSTPWYHRIRDLSRRVGARPILDLGLHDQAPSLEPADRTDYRFVLSGVTPSERRQLDALALDAADDERTIPWAFVGHATPHRAALIDHMIQSVDPRGFVYMPRAVPFTESGSPHINQQQLERVLSRTRYQVWRSYHSYFYMEPERFRNSLLTGSVPVKIVASRRDVPKDSPFSYLMLEADDLGGRLTSAVFPRVRRQFWDDWRRFPTLAQELARVLREAGIAADGRSSQAA
jgi:hypothetical protein